ncbi:MAG: TldD/PmbA family protein, partial [candidate division Zixibacteria bacterium]|nr:TldD/PmbA family protein [candidate division Zixibacteria bacterium]
MSEMSRRKFLETGSKGIALASIPFIFGANPLAAIMAPGGGGLKDYYEHFGVNESIINQVMGTALEKGGDFCDLYFQHKISNSIGLEDNIVSRASTDVALGVGIRVVREDQTGYSFTEEISLKAMKEAAQTAANIANANKSFNPVELKHHQTPSYYNVNTRWEDVGIDTKIPMLQQINDKMASIDKRVIKTQVYFGDSNDYMMVATSDGRVAYDYRPQTRVFAVCNAEENGRRENNYDMLGGRMGIEYYTPESLENLAISTVKKTVDLFEAVKPEAGEMEVVLAAGDAGILLHEAIGHGMEADFNRRGESLFADKIGKKVAEDFVSIVDDGTLPNYRGSLNVDDEGNDTEVTYLVEKGILKTYLHDKISAKHYDVKPTGNGRRESF